MLHGLSLSEISHVIALATAPAFLLGGTVAFLTLLASRMSGIVDRVRALNDIDDHDQRRAQLKSDMPVLRRRARLIHLSMSLSILSGVTTALLVAITFIGALFDLQLETLIATLFVLTLLLFMASLCLLVREAIIALGEFKHYL